MLKLLDRHEKAFGLFGLVKLKTVTQILCHGLRLTRKNKEPTSNFQFVPQIVLKKKQNLNFFYNKKKI